MKQYIDKSALVAEIEKQRNAYIGEPSKYKVLSRILSFLDTLEVKEDVVSNAPLANSLEISRHGNSHNGGNGNLEEAASQYPSVICRISPQWKSEVENVFKAGAEWQKEQFEKNRLKHCNSITNEQAELEQGFIDQHLDKYNRMPTYLDAIEYGIDYGKQQMIIKACEWLKENKEHPFIGCEDPCLSGYLTDEFIEGFKKAMEE